MRLSFICRLEKCSQGINTLHTALIPPHNQRVTLTSLVILGGLSLIGAQIDHRKWQWSYPDSLTRIFKNMILSNSQLTVSGYSMGTVNNEKQWRSYCSDSQYLRRPPDHSAAAPHLGIVTYLVDSCSQST